MGETMHDTAWLLEVVPAGPSRNLREAGGIVVNMMRVIGIALIVLGIVGFLVGRFTYTKDTDKVELGPIGVEVKDKETVRIPQALAALSFAGGIVLVAAGSRRRHA